MERPENSTNVRKQSRRRAPAALRVGFGALASVAPPLAARVAEHLFLTPPRPRPTRARAAVPDAERFDLRFQGGKVAGYRWENGGPTVLLLHGWGGHAAQLHPLVEPLLGGGFTVVAIDAPGHGASSGRESSAPAFAAAVRRLVDATGPLHAIVAHSFGAAASSLAIADGLPVERAVFVAPPANAGEFYGRFARWLGLRGAVQTATRRRIEDRLLLGFDRLSADHLGPRLDLPVLVVHDREDAEVPWLDGALVADACPRGRLITTRGLGHNRILGDEDVHGAIVAFLREPGERRRVSRIRSAPRCGGPGAEAQRAERAERPPVCLREGCGRDAEVEGEGLCATCALERELFDRETRWRAA